MQKTEAPQMEITEVDIDKIIIGERARKEFGDIDELAASISELGLLQPILCHRGAGEIWLMDGHRRILAYQKMNRKAIPAVFFDPEDPKDVAKLFQAQYDANMKRKDFTPSEAAGLYDKVKSWVETKRRFQESQAQESSVDAGSSQRGESPRKNKGSEKDAKEKKKDTDFTRTRDQVAESVGMSSFTLRHAKEVVDAAKEDPQYADLVKRMDETGKVDPAYKELQLRKGIEAKPKDQFTNSLTVRMPDGRQKKMASINSQWFENKNVIQWIMEGVGLGTKDKEIIILREGNRVQVFDSTNTDGLLKGIKALIKKYGHGNFIKIVGGGKVEESRTNEA